MALPLDICCEGEAVVVMADLHGCWLHPEVSIPVDFYLSQKPGSGHRLIPTEQVGHPSWYLAERDRIE